MKSFSCVVVLLISALFAFATGTSWLQNNMKQLLKYHKNSKVKRRGEKNTQDVRDIALNTRDSVVEDALDRAVNARGNAVYMSDNAVDTLDRAVNARGNAVYTSDNAVDTLDNAVDGDNNIALELDQLFDETSTNEINQSTREDEEEVRKGDQFEVILGRNF